MTGVAPLQHSTRASQKSPVACIVIGMAGSGKTTLMQRLNSHLHEVQAQYYLVNLDPAVIETPFGANVDIRDTVNFGEVMKQYKLGPNGGILTALNLFAVRFEQVIQLVEKRGDGLDYILLDTPGQIEIFTWSASGQIIVDSLASVLPTVIIYVVDTMRCGSCAVTFMSNMLYACSIFYKMKMPLLICFNKTDLHSHEGCEKWMKDFEAFTEALQAERSYMGTLAQSMALMLEEFYATLTTVGVSALTGDGMVNFFRAVDTAATQSTTTFPNYRALARFTHCIAQCHTCRERFRDVSLICLYRDHATLMVDIEEAVSVIPYLRSVSRIRLFRFRSEWRSD